ncbi:hypothetical protein ACQP3J_31280, partial [Escherichia coli]
MTISIHKEKMAMGSGRGKLQGCQRMVRIASRYSKSGRQGTIPSWNLQRKDGPFNTLVFVFPVYRTVRKCISVVLSYPICSH